MRQHRRPPECKHWPPSWSELAVVVAAYVQLVGTVTTAAEEMPAVVELEVQPSQVVQAVTVARTSSSSSSSSSSCDSFVLFSV